MNIDDLISVIIPAYNHERYIEETVRSIMAQTYQNIELLVMDDGSTDGTFAKLQGLKPECEKRFGRVVFETRENRGVCTTMNELVAKARGEYLYDMGSDDVAKPRAIETLHAFLSENPDYVLAVGDDELIDSASERIYWGRCRTAVPSERAVYKTFGEVLKCREHNAKGEFGSYVKLLAANHIPNGYLMRADAVRETGGYILDPEDWNMMLQLAKIGKFKFIPEILFSYRQHENNTVRSAAYLSQSRKIRKQQLMAEKEWCFQNGYQKLWKDIWRKNFGLRKCIRNFRKKLFRIRLSKNKKVVQLFGITFYQKGNDDD